MSGVLRRAAEILRRIKLRLDRRHHGLRDLVLHGEHIRQIAVVALGPEVTAGSDIVQLRGDADMVAILAHGALDDIADAEFLADLLQVHRLALVDEGGVAGDHIEPAQLRQRGDDVLADAFGEIFLLGFAGDVGERQHGDRGTIERRQRDAVGLGAASTAAELPGAVRRALARRDGALTSPTKRKPLRAMVRITAWSLPLSPTALRAALMRLVRVDSETMRPSQMVSIRSSLVTTWSRFSTR